MIINCPPWYKLHTGDQELINTCQEAGIEVAFAVTDKNRVYWAIKLEAGSETLWFQEPESATKYAVKYNEENSLKVGKRIVYTLGKMSHGLFVWAASANLKKIRCILLLNEQIKTSIGAKEDTDKLNKALATTPHYALLNEHDQPIGFQSKAEVDSSYWIIDLERNRK